MAMERNKNVFYVDSAEEYTYHRPRQKTESPFGEGRTVEKSYVEVKVKRIREELARYAKDVVGDRGFGIANYAANLINKAMGRKELRHELRKIRLSHDCIMGILARTAEHVGYYEEAKKIKSSKCIKSPICFKDRRTASKAFDRCYLAMNAIILAIERRAPSEEIMRRITAILDRLKEKENRYQKISEIMLRKIKEKGIAIDGSGKMMKTIVMEIIAKSLEDLYPRDSIDYKDIFEKIEAIANEML
jgi:hypothetical protein